MRRPSCRPCRGAEMSAYPVSRLSAVATETCCRCYRIRFNPVGGDQGLAVLARWRDPQSMLAVLVERHELAATAALPKAGDAGELVVLFAESGLHGDQALRQRLEDWMAAGAGESRMLLEAPSFGERILWRPGRALIIGKAERCQELLDGLIAFAWYESRLRLLEAESDDAWPSAEDDIALTQLPGRRDLTRKGYLNERIRCSTLWRMRHTRLQSHLEKAPAHLHPAVQRLYNELAVQAEVHDRLATLDDRLEVFQDLYELAADRLSEYSYFRGELLLEWLIVVLLLLEAGLGLGAFWWR